MAARPDADVQMEEQPDLQLAAQVQGAPQTETELSTEEVFNNVWNKLEKEYRSQNQYMTLPSEIIWLNGAPGSGKSTNTPFILRARGLDARPIIMSSLLQAEEFRERIDRGEMIPDSEVLERLLRALLDPRLRKGVLVDGFPRTTAQVETLTMLYDKMKELRSTCDSNLLVHYPKPRFLIAILYVSEEESVHRQIARGSAAQKHNLRVKEIQGGTLAPNQAETERKTDQDVALCRKRYRIFRAHRDTLLRLQDKFPFAVIDAEKPLEVVQNAILEQFQYQSSQELRADTYDIIQNVPLASKVSSNARGALVERLDMYQAERPDMFKRAIIFINKVMVPQMQRHAFAGEAVVKVSEDRIRMDQLFIDMVLDVLSERGYMCHHDRKLSYTPTSIDRTTLRILTEERVEHLFYVKFPAVALRH
ncbi:adenylate kinase [Porphyridium purpureum]|uniref:Adenylate kinase n=1 Tax=Porphyridium purpureum TaxID=35688 RepID=A0A5J4YPW7_PORPP|nr:adenylate kinase [Porphyridium purpureum]|eukprot:POR2024..scf222_8